MERLTAQAQCCYVGTIAADLQAEAQDCTRFQSVLQSTDNSGGCVITMLAIVVMLCRALEAI